MPRSRYNGQPRNKPLARSSEPGAPRVFLPEVQGAHYGGAQSGQSSPRALPYDRRARSSTQALDQQTAREQLRAMQQERMNRDAARWKSEQTKRKSGASTTAPRVEPKPIVEDDSEAAGGGLDSGPALFAPTNGK
jgi:hypothetical protein